MRKNYYFSLLLLFVFGVWNSAFAQNIPTQSEKITDETGIPTFIRFDEKKSVSENNAYNLLRDELQLQSTDKLKLIKESTDQLGFTHKRYQQYYKGIKVEFVFYQVNSKAGMIESISGNFNKIENLNITPQLNSVSALTYAISNIGAETYMWQDAESETYYKKHKNNTNASYYPKGELVIMKHPNPKSKEEEVKDILVYKFNIYAKKPLSRDYVYVEANTGKIIMIDPIIKHSSNNTHNTFKIVDAHNTRLVSAPLMPANSNGNADTRYSGNRNIKTDSYNGKYRLRETTRGNGVETYDMNEGTNYNNAVDFEDNDNNWTSAEWNNANKDNAALDAHWGAEMTYDYWKNVHNRNSFDDNGAKIKSYVHYDSNYQNAYWNGDVMTYGDGASRFDALTSLDITAHEIGHAVMSSTADMVYQREPGALNEGYSDIWAAAVEFYAAPEKDAWLIGEDIDKQEEALRSMKDPKSQGQPDTYQGTNWVDTDCFYPSSFNDYCGVHTNSGVLNHWFYILSVGKTGSNDMGTSYNVSGIGIDKAAKIAWRAESQYLGSQAQFADARTYTIKSAEDLYGVGSNEATQTAESWKAVGVGDQGGGGSDEYCISKSNNASYEWIAKVEIGDFVKSSGSAKYSDFTSETISLEAGTAYNLKLTPGFRSTTYNEYWKIWIDYNGDKDFDDAGELVYDSGSMSKSAVSGSFTVSSSAEGETRMRVSMKYNGSQTACETFTYGEVEDYTVSFGASTPICNATSNLAANNITISSADISWDVVSSAESYNLEYKKASDTEWESTPVTTNSYSLSGLDTDTEYQFKVATICSFGSSNFSATFSFNTDYICTVPSNLLVSNITATSTDLSWDAIEHAQSYDISYKKQSATTWTTVNVASNTHNILGLSASTNYDFKVKTKCDNDSESDFSATSSFTTLELVCNIPDGLATIDIIVNSATLKWNTVIDASGFDVQYRESGTSSWTTESVIANSLDISALMSNTIYEFQVRTDCGEGNYSDYSSQSSFTTLDCIVPSGLASSDITANSATLSWSEVTEAQSYDILYREAGGTWNSETSSSTSYGLSGLMPLTPYEFKVRSNCGSNIYSDYSIVYSFTTEDNSTPVDYCDAKANSSMFEWIDRVALGDMNNTSGADNGYGDYTSKVAHISTGSNTIVLSTGFRYWNYAEKWAVYIDFNQDGDFNDLGEKVVQGASSGSGDFSANIDVPSNAMAGNTRMRVMMSFSVNPGPCDNYSYGEVEDYTVSIGSEGFNFIGSSIAINAKDLSDDVESIFTIYPLPAVDVLHVNTGDQTGILNIEIFNMSGKLMKIKELSHGNDAIDVSTLSSGTYMINVNDGQRVTSHKFIKK